MHQNGTALIRYADATFRSVRLVVAIAGAIMIAAVTYAVFAQKQYGSAMKILVQNTRAASVISADRGNPASSGTANPDAVEAQINSEVNLIESVDLMEGLVRYRDQELAHIAPPQEGTLRMARELSDVQRRIEVTPLRKTNIIEVTFRDKDPQFAKKSLKWLSTAFLDKHAELRRPAGAYQFFDSQTKSYEAQVHEAEASLVNFQRANNVVALAQERTLVLDDLNQLNRELDATKSDVQESRTRLGSLQGRLRGVNSRLVTQVRDAPNQYAAERMNTLLVELRNKRTQLLTRFTPEDRLVKELDEQIASTQTALDKANEKKTVETVSDNNPIKMTLQEDMEKTQVHEATAETRLQQLEQQAAQYKARLDNLQKISVDNDALERRVQDLKQVRETYAQKRDEADIDDELDRRKIVDVAIAQEPTLSVQPVQPHRLLTIALGALTACFACLALIMVIDALRETAYTPAELEAMVSCPVLATVPEWLHARPPNRALKGKALSIEGAGLGLMQENPLLRDGTA